MSDSNLEIFQKNYRRVVIKIGSSLLVENSNSDLSSMIRKNWLNSLVKDCHQLIENGTEIIITTSGAVALGRKILGTKNPKFYQSKISLAEKQAAAAAGQIELMSIYRDFFMNFQLPIAQILLTAADCNMRQSFLNCKKTIETILASGAVPIINENDSIAVEEIKFGDNDRLASRVAQMTSADLLILFSDIDGLYTKNPRLDQNAKFIEKVEEIDESIEKMAGNAGSSVGTGGMITKIVAAKMATSRNCDTVITSGIENGCLEALFKAIKKSPVQNQKNSNQSNSAKKFTIFLSISNKEKTKRAGENRKSWLAGMVNFKGEVIINQKAAETLRQRKASLLPIGAVAVKGEFLKNDAILIRDENGNQIGNGISNHSSKEVSKILQKNSKEVAEILGKSAKPELIHLDNMAILNRF